MPGQASEQPPIIGKDLFEAVQARLAERAVTRNIRRSSSPSFLSGLLFDDCGNRMSPSHANKKGVRYRYYVSQALLQNRKGEAGAITRVPAPDVEDLVVAAIRHHIAGALDTKEMDAQQAVRGADDRLEKSAWHVPTRMSSPAQLSDRDLVTLHIERIMVRPRHIDITLRSAPNDTHERAGSQGSEAQEMSSDQNAHEGHHGAQEQRPEQVPATTTIQIPWMPTMARARKGIVWKPSGQSSLDSADRTTLLTAIAKARLWMDDLMEGRAASFRDIADREGKVERHIRFLMPLACLSPLIVDAILNDRAPADLTVTTLARALPHGWAMQEHQLGIA